MKYLSLCLTASLLTGCSSVSRLTDVTNLVDYSNHKSVKVLEMPADLKTPDYDKTYLTNVSDNGTVAQARISDAVPLVDGSLAAPSKSQVRIVTLAGETALQVDDDKLFWKRTTDALKAMGMTVSKSDQATGMIDARDRSLVSDPGSPIGAMLNRALGKMNQGKKYKITARQEGGGGFITIRDEASKKLSTSDAKSLLLRLRKEYTDS